MNQGTVGGLIDKLGRTFRRQNLSLVTAESCTGGMLASAIVSDPEASPILDRAFVVYSIDAKCEMLGLEHRRVEECGGVAEDVARAMASAALERSGANLSVAITGFAGPREGDEEVGLVHLATATRDITHHRALHLGDIGRGSVCEEAIKVALQMLIDLARSL
jgi:nicotinamide-nucleotide amidase